MKTIIQTPTPKPENSINFYTRLGFRNISRDPLLFSDGKAVVEINPERSARAGIKIIKNSWDKEVAELKEVTAVNSIPGGYLIGDPSGMWIYLIEAEPKQKHQPYEDSFSTLGNYAGLSLESTDIKKSAYQLEILGFHKEAGSLEQGWITYTNKEDFKISLMPPLSCPHLFFNPSLTYFNGKDNLKIIDKIRSLKIPITEEITHFNKEGNVDNIIIRDPGGLGFFIFND